jgi:hypothetical protein
MTRISSARMKRCKRKKEVAIGNPDKICREIRKEKEAESTKIVAKRLCGKMKGRKKEKECRII